MIVEYPCLIEHPIQPMYITYSEMGNEYTLVLYPSVFYEKGEPYIKYEGHDRIFLQEFSSFEYITSK